MGRLGMEPVTNGEGDGGDDLRPGVSDPQPEPEPFPGAHVMRDLMDDRTIENIVASLKSMYPDAEADVEDQVINSVLKYFEKCTSEDIKKPAGWIFTAARRRIINLLERRKKREKPIDAVPDVPVDSDEAGVLDDISWQAIAERIGRWESGRLRTITLLKLEGIFLGDPLTDEEVAHDAGNALGQDIATAQVATYWGRGKKKLLAELTAYIEETGTNPIDGSEI